MYDMRGAGKDKDLEGQRGSQPGTLGKNSWGHDPSADIYDINQFRSSKFIGIQFEKRCLMVTNILAETF